jgi:hypothetical protein
MAGDHQVGVIANGGAPALLFRQPAGIHLEGSTQIGLADKIKVDSVERRRRSIGAPVCALAMPNPAANDRSTAANAMRAMRLVTNARLIENTPFIRSLERSYSTLLASIFMAPN